MLLQPPLMVSIGRRSQNHRPASQSGQPLPGVGDFGQAGIGVFPEAVMPGETIC